MAEETLRKTRKKKRVGRGGNNGSMAEQSAYRDGGETGRHGREKVG